MRALALLLALVPLAGCIFCGPTVYHLSAVTASTRFTDETWDLARVEAGLRAAGLDPHAASPTYVTATDADVSVTANGATPYVELILSFPTQAQGTRDDVEAAAAREEQAHEPRARQILAAFESAANWTADGALRWDAGILHGDC